MNTNATEIFTHDNEIDVAHKINAIELENWINHLNYVKSEVDNLTSFYNAQSDRKRNSKESMIQRFEMKRVENDVLLDAISRYKNTRSQLIECDSTDCDMSFINEHESCRRMYLYHIDKYRKLKDQFFNEIKDQVIA